MDEPDIRPLSSTPTRLSVLREVPWGRVAVIITAPYAVLCLYSFARSELVPADNQEKYQLLHYIPSWQWRTWLIIFLIIFILSAWEGVFRAIRKRYKYQLELLARIATVESERDQILSGPRLEGFAHRSFIGLSNGKSMALVQVMESLSNSMKGDIPTFFDLDILFEFFIENVSPEVRQIVAIDMYMEANQVREKLTRVARLDRYALAFRTEPGQKTSSAIPSMTIEQLSDLYPKLMSTTPLQKGHKAEGWLLFRIRNTSPTLIDQTKPKFTLLLTDSSGREHVISRMLTTERAGQIVTKNNNS